MQDIIEAEENPVFFRDSEVWCDAAAIYSNVKLLILEHSSAATWAGTTVISQCAGDDCAVCLSAWRSCDDTEYVWFRGLTSPLKIWCNVLWEMRSSFWSVPLPLWLVPLISVEVKWNGLSYRLELERQGQGRARPGHLVAVTCKDWEIDLV